MALLGRTHALWFVTVLTAGGCTALTSLSDYAGGPEGADAAAAAADGSPGASSSGASGSSGNLIGRSGAPDANASSGGDAAPDSPLCTVQSTAAASPTLAVATSGGAVWTNVDQVKQKDDSAASVLLPGDGDESQYLLASGFKFQIPATAQIRGVTVAVRRMASLDDLRDEEVKLSVNGSISGVNKPHGAWPQSYGAETYGGVSDAWSVALTPALVNAENFGVRLSAKSHTTGSVNGFIDAISVVVTYCN